MTDDAASPLHLLSGTVVADESAGGAQVFRQEARAERAAPVSGECPLHPARPGESRLLVGVTGQG